METRIKTTIKNTLGCFLIQFPKESLLNCVPQLLSSLRVSYSTCPMPYFLSCHTCLVLYVLSCHTFVVPYLLSRVIFIVHYVFSFLTCLVPYMLSCLTCPVRQVISCPSSVTYLRYLMSSIIEVISCLIALVSHTSYVFDVLDVSVFPASTTINHYDMQLLLKKSIRIVFLYVL